MMTNMKKASLRPLVVHSLTDTATFMWPPTPIKLGTHQLSRTVNSFYHVTLKTVFAKLRGVVQLQDYLTAKSAQCTIESDVFCLDYALVRVL